MFVLGMVVQPVNKGKRGIGKKVRQVRHMESRHKGRYCRGWRKKKQPLHIQIAQHRRADSAVYLDLKEKKTFL